MAIRKKRRLPQPRPERGYQPRLPHPSWRLAPVDAGDAAAAGITTAGEFWSRLGL